MSSIIDTKKLYAICIIILIIVLFALFYYNDVFCTNSSYGKAFLVIISVLQTGIIMYVTNSLEKEIKRKGGVVVDTEISDSFSRISPEFIPFRYKLELSEVVSHAPLWYLKENISAIFSDEYTRHNALENPNIIPLLNEHAMRLDKSDLIILARNPKVTELNSLGKAIHYHNSPRVYDQLFNATRRYPEVFKEYIKNPNLNEYFLDANLVNKFEVLDELAINPNDKAVNIVINNLSGLSKEGWWNLAENTNPKAISIIRGKINELDEIGWKHLALNPNAIDILEDNPDKIIKYKVWSQLCQNPNPKAVNILRENIGRLNEYHWQILAKNPNATDIIEENLDKLDERGWEYLAENPNAIDIMNGYLKNISKKTWARLVRNPKAIDIIKENMDIIKKYDLWNSLSGNPEIFMTDSKPSNIRLNEYIKQYDNEMKQNNGLFL